jgi:hypothetical protein
MLEQKQTHPDGRVWYGRPITYSKIANWFGADRPAERTLRRWMADLRKTQKIIVRHVRMNQGIRVAIAAPRKHFRSNAAPSNASRQMALFSGPVEIPVQKPQEKLRNSQVDVRPPVAAPCGHWWPEKDVKTLKEHLKENARAPARAAPHPADDREPWNPEKRAKKLDEFYSTRRELARIPSQHPRYAELLARLRRLDDELTTEQLKFSDTG